MLAAMLGHTACVTALLRADANTELRHRYGDTAVQMAEANGHAAIVELIRQHSSSPQPPAASSSGSHDGTRMAFWRRRASARI